MLACPCYLVFLAVPAATGDFGVAGDPAVLDAVRGGVSTSEERHSRGSIRAESFLDGRRAAEIEARWNEGGSTRGRYRLWHFLEPSTPAAESPSETFFVQNDELRAEYIPASETLNIDRYRPIYVEPETLTVLPSDAWFDAGGPYRDRDDWRLSVLLDPSRSVGRERTESFSVEREGDQVFIRRLYSRGAKFEATASLTLGGNITSSRMTVNAGEGTAAYVCAWEWVPDGGGFRVDSMTATVEQDVAVPKLSVNYLTLPAGRVRSDPSYTVESLGVPSSASVVEVTRDPITDLRKTVILRRGNNRRLPAPTDSATLKTLGEAAAAGSFSGVK